MNSLIKLIRDCVKKVEIINMMYGANPDKSKSGNKNDFSNENSKARLSGMISIKLVYVSLLSQLALFGIT